MSKFFRLEVDEVALADELFAFVTDRSGARSTRPVIAELQDLNPEMVEVLESMVLDGIDRREYVDEYIHAVVGRFNAWGFN